MSSYVHLADGGSKTSPPTATGSADDTMTTTKRPSLPARRRASQTGAVNMATYSSSKGAVITLILTLAQELGPHGITVNTIPPGSITGTIMADANISEESAGRLAATLPVRRVGLPEDIANACAFLCSEASSYVTGQIIGVNGGRVVS